jgi:hypothetical protein
MTEAEAWCLLRDWPDIGGLEGQIARDEAGRLALGLTYAQLVPGETDERARSRR